MHEAELDAELLGAFFAQLETSAEIHEIRVQRQREQLSGSDARARLAALHKALLDGALHGVQIRYRHVGAEWIDTLLRREAGFRLVRMRAPV